MRVLALVSEAYGGFGGIAEYNRQFLSALAEYGAQVTVLPRSGQISETPVGISQSSPRLGKLSYILALALTVARKSEFDLVWCGHINLAPLGAIVARTIRKPFWLQIHGIDAWSRPNRVIQAAVAHADLVTAVSRYTRHRFLSWANLLPERVRVLPNCVDPKFTPGSKPEKLIQRYDLSDKRVLISVGRMSALERYKGHDRVLRVLPELLEQYPDLTYVIGGNGDDRERLIGLAEDVGVGDSCRFIGRIPESEIVDHYRLADVFTMPSTGEGFGIVYLEAMACGIPAVGLNVDGSIDPLSASSLGLAVAESELARGLIDALRMSESISQQDFEADLIEFSTTKFALRVNSLVDSVRLVG